MFGVRFGVRFTDSFRFMSNVKARFRVGVGFEVELRVAGVKVNVRLDWK